MQQCYQNMYFADELFQVTPRTIPSSFGNIYSITAGTPGQPLILVVHGSGPKNCSDQYKSLLQEYLVRVSYIQKFYVVAIDCPGYGKSEGSKQAVKTFPLKLFKQILSSLKYKFYYAMYGHSQGGAAIFNAVYQEPCLTEFMVMDRPVCGNIQRFRGFSLPTLLIYDIEDDGHPLWQGKLLYKELTNTQFYTYRTSVNQYWVPDNIWNKMLDFFTKKQKRTMQVESRGKANLHQRRSQIKSEMKKMEFHQENQKFGKYKISRSMGKKQEILKKLKIQEKLIQIQEIQKSELFSISSPLCKIDTQSQESINNQPFYFQKQESKDQLVKEQKQIEIKQPLKQEKEEKGPSIFQKDENRCSICYESYYRPIVTNCNHIYCHKCILESLLVNQKCPLCRAKITKKTENPKLHEQILATMTVQKQAKRQNQLKRMIQMLKSIVYIQIGNNSIKLQTKKSISTKTKKKYSWQIYVKSPKNFALEEVAFNINMGNAYSKPIVIKNQPFVFESRGTFSFSCQITIRPKNKQYAELISVYRIEIEPGNHHKIVALKPKWYTK